MRSRAAHVLFAVTVLALAAPGCGPGPTTAQQSTRAETPQKPAKPPGGWHRRFDRTHGYSISVPPGWATHSGGSASLYRSPDGLVAVSVSVDRTPGAFRVSPAAFARRTLRALKGYRRKLEPGPAHDISHTPLDAAIAGATGVTKKGGVREEVEAAVLRRDHLVNYTAVIVANGAAPPQELADARVFAASIRDQPLG